MLCLSQRSVPEGRMSLANLDAIFFDIWWP